MPFECRSHCTDWQASPDDSREESRIHSNVLCAIGHSLEWTWLSNIVTAALLHVSRCRRWAWALWAQFWSLRGWVFEPSRSILDSTWKLWGCCWTWLPSSCSKTRMTLSLTNCSVLTHMLGLPIASFIEATAEVSKQFSSATKQRLK